MRCLTLPEDWLQVKSVFRRRWNILHALGALDGKHIPIRYPQGGGSRYHNYKGSHSIVLLALVDGDYKFLWVEVGAARSSQDGSIGFPENEFLGIAGPKVNFFILGDNAFSLKP